MAYGGAIGALWTDHHASNPLSAMTVARYAFGGSWGGVIGQLCETPLSSRLPARCLDPVSPVAFRCSASRAIPPARCTPNQFTQVASVHHTRARGAVREALEPPCRRRPWWRALDGEA